MFVVSMAAAWAGDVVFDFTAPEALTPAVTPSETASTGVDLNGMTFTNGTVSISVADGSGSASKLFTQSEKKGLAKELRVYNGNSLTVVSTENITSIVLAGNKTGKMTVDGTEITDGKWSGSAKSVTLNVTGTFNTNTITVTTSAEAGGETPEPETPVATDTLRLDFTTNTWGLPEGSANLMTEAKEFTNGTHKVTLQGSGTAGYYYNASGYLMLGKTNATLTLPAFDFDVEKIIVTGNKGASASSTHNIFVGDVAVSTEAVGSDVAHTYEIAEAYQAAGTVYTFKVLNSKDVQIKMVEVIKKSAGANPDPNPGETEEPGTPVGPDTLWSECFTADNGAFTVENKSLAEGLTNVWAWGSYGYDNYMKASAYAGSAKAAESWLVSPLLDMTNASEIEFSFKHAGKFVGTIENEIFLKAREDGGEWADVAFSAYPTNKDYTFVRATADFSAYVGKTLQFAFVYKSSEEAAGTWEVDSVLITGKGEVKDATPTPVYTTIAALKEAAETSAEMYFDFSELLVTGVIGKNVYVTDGTESLLIYGATPAFAKGDKVSGRIAGKITLYNGAPQIGNPDFSAVKVESSDNAVEPVVVTIEQLLADDAADKYVHALVRVEDVYFMDSVLTKKNVTIASSETDNEITLRDNFNKFANYEFKTDETYNVNAFVSFYNGTAQLYPASEADIELITTLTNPETAWAHDLVAIQLGEPWNVENTLSTKNAAGVVYSSSNEDVAVVGADGKIEVKGFGYAVITASTAETTEFIESKASFELFVIEGKGTLESPYSPADVKYFNGKVTEKVWVKGTIYGYWTNDGAVAGTDEAPASNISIGTAACAIPVQLSSGTFVRTDLNIKDNPSKVGAEVWLYGNIANYFNVAGLKNVNNYSTDGVTGIEAVEASDAEAVIYDLSGRRVEKAVKGIYVINGKKVLVK